MHNLLYTLLLLGVLACTGPPHDPISPNDPTDETQPESSAPGFGTSKSRPEGIPFAFPAGISLVQKPRVDGDCWSEARKQKKVKGSGGAVGFCLTFSNANDYPVRVEIPPGLIWVAETNESFQDISQNGIIVKTVTVLVPAHAIETAWLIAYCINVDRSGSRPGDSYEIQPIQSNHPGIQSLASQLANKKINEEEYTTEPTTAERQQLAFVQVAVNDVETYGSVQPSTQVYLNQLPNAK
ncbi:hypothetical protein EXU85_22770 [Spirosoma sp. KCTC 42546]|uniref:hypothetical protein n=1 Tax=Spirosoma sp. KCTC 42546 TaxID=2520506 RepID=UPI00115BEDA7|nr:hypothetical protein [Spirosoma sp. KCTC 42546]QDK81280.1 hypothetical protein EXU85_22770 [Spirosoma sp. KCTC 42546]